MTSDKTSWVQSSFGERLKWARLQRGLTQTALAGTVGVSRNAVSYWENDQNKAEGRNLARAAEALHVDQDWLDTGKGAPHGYRSPGVSERTVGTGTDIFDTNKIGVARPEIAPELRRMERMLRDGLVTKSALKSFLDMLEAIRREG